MLDFSNRTVIVTGGTSGIGLAAAVMFGQQGARVVVAGRDEGKGQDAQNQLMEAGVPAMFYSTDVRNEDQVQALVCAAIETFGPPHVLVNSAGLMTRILLTELEQADWELMLDTNLRGVYLTCKHTIPAMSLRGKGAIVNVASYLGSFGARPTSPAYAAAKAGVVSLTRSLALQVSPQGIRVNAVCPAFTITPSNQYIIDDAPDPAAKEREIALPYPLGRLGRPEDIAAAILFLASDEAGWITGTTLVVDGGLTAR